MNDHLTHAMAAEAQARAAADDDERRLYMEIARLWRELAQVNIAAAGRERVSRQDPSSRIRQNS